jgi:hypothetical protein
MASRHPGAEVIAPVLDRHAETIREKLFRENQAEKQPDQEAEDEFAHVTLQRRFWGRSLAKHSSCKQTKS